MCPNCYLTFDMLTQTVRSILHLDARKCAIVHWQLYWRQMLDLAANMCTWLQRTFGQCYSSDNCASIPHIGIMETTVISLHSLSQHYSISLYRCSKNMKAKTRRCLLPKCRIFYNTVYTTISRFNKAIRSISAIERSLNRLNKVKLVCACTWMHIF